MSLAGSRPRTPGASSLMAPSLACPCAGPGASQCAAPSLLLLLLLLHPARGVAMAHRHPDIKGISLSRDVGRTPLGGVGSGPCGSSVLTVFAALPALETPSLAVSPVSAHPVILPLPDATPSSLSRASFSLPFACGLPLHGCYSDTLPLSPQPVASVTCRGRSSGAWMPLRRSGHGRSACTMRASTSVAGPSSMSTGSCQLPTASAGEWMVPNAIPMDV